MDSRSRQYTPRLRDRKASTKLLVGSLFGGPPPVSPIKKMSFSRASSSSPRGYPVPPSSRRSRSDSRSSHGSSPRRRRQRATPRAIPKKLSPRLERWEKRRHIALNHPHLMVNRRCNPAEISPQLTLLLCDNTRMLMSAFKKYDYDGSGTLDRQEFRDMIMKMAKREHFSLTCQDADMIMQAFDADKSGFIDRWELGQGIQNAHSVCTYDTLNRRLPPKQSRGETMSQRLGLTAPPVPPNFGQDIYQQRLQNEMQYSTAPYMSPRTPLLFNKAPTQRRNDFLRKQKAKFEESLAHKTENLMTRYKESTLSDHGPVLKKGLFSSRALY
jgi:hypothetical protein